MPNSIKKINGNIYEGEWKDGLCNGKGKNDIELEKIIIYNMEKEKYHGLMVIYEGDFENNIAHGVGKMYLIRKDQTYEGELKNGKRNGKGKMTFSSGNFTKENGKIINIMVKEK